ncbi:tape measure protein [Cerasicoccus fimbriatus]|uniref:tape measure protein n=1 Tax=Cerasicoccus fimbriatus TaxID=3014554 RepID=UPI0022B3380F|nr:tape measure protein [Cerasicoccus sp. TK19100]
MTAKDKYEILIQVKKRLEGMDETLRALDEGRKKADSLGRSLRDGFAVGLGNFAVQQISRMPHLIGNMTRALVDAKLEMDALEAPFDYVFGPRAQAEMEKMRAKADHYGQSLQTVAAGYGRIQAGAAKSNLTQQETEYLFDGLLAASTALSLSADRTEGALTAVEQIISKNTVSAEELKQQLGERLWGAFNLAAEAMDLTTEQLSKLLETGKLGAEEFLPRLARALHETFDPLVAERAGKLQGQLNRLNNEWFELKLSLGDTGFIDNLTDGIGELIEQMKDPEFQNGVIMIADGLKTASEAAIKLVSELPTIARTAAVALESYRNVWGQLTAPINGPEAPISYQRALDDALAKYGPMANESGTGLLSSEDLGIAPVSDIVGSADPRRRIAADALKFNSSMLGYWGTRTGQASALRSRVGDDPLTPLVRKQEELVALLEREIELREISQGFREAMINSPEVDDDTRIKLIEQFNEEGLNLAELENMLARLDSFGDAFQSSFNDWINGFGTTGEQVAGILTGTLQSAIDSVATSVDGLIQGTMTWGDAFQNVGSQIVSTLVQLVVQFIAQQMIMLAMRAIFGKSMMATAAVEAASLSAIWATPATLASIASYGGAAAIAPASIALALGTTQSVSAGFGVGAAGVIGGGIPGFAEGGLITGPGGPKDDAILARLSNMEFVMPADKTRAYLPILEQMRAGRFPGFAEGGLVGGSPSTGSGGATEIIIVGSMADALEAAADRSGFVTIRQADALIRKRM